MDTSGQPTTTFRPGLLLLLALIGAAVLALFAATSAVSALDVNRVDLPEVSIPAAKCTGTDACTGVVDLSQVADGSCNGNYSCFHSTPYTGTVGAGSCNGSNTCYQAAGPIEADSCSGNYACYSADSPIGAGSCSGSYACYGAAGPIGAGSCSVAAACYGAAGPIGNNSCNTTGTACQAAGAFPVGDCQHNDVAPAACIVPRAHLPLIQR